MSIAPFPHRYEVAVDENDLTARDRSALLIGPPPQFGGTGERDWSPEELLLGAVAACLKTTFDAYARRQSIVIDTFRARAEGVLEKTREGPAFTSVTILVELAVRGGEDEVLKAKETLERAEHDCIISRAIKAPVTLAATVRSATLSATSATSAANGTAPTTTARTATP